MGISILGYFMLPIKQGSCVHVASLILGKGSKDILTNGGEKSWFAMVQSEKKNTKKTNQRKEFKNASNSPTFGTSAMK